MNLHESDFAGLLTRSIKARQLVVYKRTKNKALITIQKTGNHGNEAGIIPSNKYTGSG
jgi:mRNA-degrading endonuclease YafQ of YafQ-DinJ toxin-antitoxin module